jgi:hypothetical protein
VCVCVFSVFCLLSLRSRLVAPTLVDLCVVLLLWDLQGKTLQRGPTAEDSESGRPSIQRSVTDALLRLPNPSDANRIEVRPTLVCCYTLVCLSVCHMPTCMYTLTHSHCALCSVCVCVCVCVGMPRDSFFLRERTAERRSRADRCSHRCERGRTLALHPAFRTHSLRTLSAGTIASPSHLRRCLSATRRYCGLVRVRGVEREAERV